MYSIQPLASILLVHLLMSFKPPVYTHSQSNSLRPTLYIDFQLTRVNGEST